MRNLKLTNKFMIFFSVAVSVFNFTIDSGSAYGIFSLLMTLLFLMMWINFMVYTFQRKDSKRKVEVYAEVYFTLIFIAGLLMLSTLLFNYSLGEVVSYILMLIISPINGIRFLVKPLVPWNIMICIVSFVMVMLIRRMTAKE